MLRITGGALRGRKLRWTPNPRCRPTTDRVRESMMAVLAPRLPGAVCVDLFAGTGVLGIEALSRGASRVTFVDSHGPALRAIEKNLDRLGVDPDRAETVKADARSFLKRCTREGSVFDMIFADPPRGSSLGLECLEFLTAHGKPVFDLFVWERDRTDDVEPEGRVRLDRVQLVGSTRIEYWGRGAVDPVRPAAPPPSRGENP